MSQTIRLASVNVNGIRAAYRKGMHEWLEGRGIDILAMQEVRANRKQVDDLINDGWHLELEEASSPGRAGVAIASRTPLGDVRRRVGPDEFDSAGRWLEVDFDVNGTPLTVVSCYVHSGEADTPKQEEKWKFLDAMAERMAELRAERELAVVVGDLNVGHDERDIKNWKGNVKKAGFLPRERGYFTRMFTPLGESAVPVDGSGGVGLGWVDVGRELSGDVPGPYTWWSYRGKAFDTDAGWRIDYQVATPELAARASNYTVDRAAAYDQRWSDHSPVVVDYEI
ncbi:exodeoxyribonuclease III [Gulosibacter molinativorax]|uniref:Exodeoxyribonuclease III n=1 Tax=Gulosibacter molinativorax TaxID=256821 RepID=A0ABT7CAW3_9MICO|nr:exodeoxyribonuclease III [Gulosibacter molinativorax]MDJ1372338.1 exodeoxyribonuclease III [Gulosibacter molinativorax]QUY63572.1 Exodeoxyribonuclease III [Gulosibacter molinativorax]